MNLRSFVDRFWRYNRFERDRWIAETVRTHVRAGSRVLDVGAGSCPYAPLFANCEYKSHDFKQLDPGALQGRKAYGAIDYVSDIAYIPVPNESFDVILCTEVLEHVPDPLEAVQELARVLAPSGLLILTAPLLSGLHQEPYHFVGGYTPHWYRTALPQAGFDRVSVRPNRAFFSLVSQEGLRFLQRLAPWRSPAVLIALPIWLVALPLFGVILPLAAPLLDRLDQRHDFTAGYFVTARRAPAVSTP